MRIYKSGVQIGVQDTAGKNYYFTREMNANPPEGIKLAMEAPKQRKKKVVDNGSSDAG